MWVRNFDASYRMTRTVARTEKTWRPYSENQNLSDSPAGFSSGRPMRIFCTS